MQLEYLQEKWENAGSVECCSQIGVFFAWFRSHKAELVKHSMLKDVRISAGLEALSMLFSMVS